MPDIMLFQSNYQKQPVLKSETARAEDTAVYQAGGALKDLGKAVLDIENRNQTLKARADIAEVQAEMSAWFAERQASGNVENLTDEMRERLDKALDAKTRANGSGFYAQAIDAAKPDVVAGFLNQAERAKIEGTFLENRKRAEQMINAKAAFVRNNPDQWLNIENEVSGALDSVVLDAETKERLKQNARRDIAFVAANEALVNNPQALRRSIRNGDFADFLGVDEQQRFLAATVEQGGAVKTNLAVYAALDERAERGENVIADARAAMLQGLLTIADYEKFKNANPTRKKMFEYLNTVAAQGFVRDVALDARRGEAGFAADRWLNENPNASDVEVERQARIIVRNFKLNQRANLIIDDAVKNQVLNEFYFASDGSSAAAPTRAGLVEMVKNARKNNKLNSAKLKDLEKIARSLITNMDVQEAQKIGEAINGK
mgnify:CR=1 FL=1